MPVLEKVVSYTVTSQLTCSHRQTVRNLETYHLHYIPALVVSQDIAHKSVPMQYKLCRCSVHNQISDEARGNNEQPRYRLGIHCSTVPTIILDYPLCLPREQYNSMPHYTGCSLIQPWLPRLLFTSRDWPLSSWLSIKYNLWDSYSRDTSYQLSPQNEPLSLSDV